MILRMFKSTWFLSLFGLFWGLLFGSFLTYRYCRWTEQEYERTLENVYVDSTTWNLLTSWGHLHSLDKQDYDKLVWSKEVHLIGAFLTLVDHHRSGVYPWKEEEMRRNLKRTRQFMADRPFQQFNVDELEQLSTESQPWLIRAFASWKKNQGARDRMNQFLEEAFAYVDGLPDP